MACTLYLTTVHDGRSSRERLYHYARRYAPSAGYTGQLPPLLHTDKGKPYFQGLPFSFSVSHSGEWWACAFGPDTLGLDIQQQKPALPWQAIAKRFFHPEEAAFLEGRDLAAFYQIWCAKEAWVKYTGEGLAALKHFNLIHSGALNVMLAGASLTFPPMPAGYAAALWGRHVEPVQIIQDIKT